MHTLPTGRHLYWWERGRVRRHEPPANCRILDKHLCCGSAAAWRSVLPKGSLGDIAQTAHVRAVIDFPRPSNTAEGHACRPAARDRGLAGAAGAANPIDMPQSASQ